MRYFIFITLALTLAATASAQVWPDAALCGSESGLPGSPAGHLSVAVAGASLHSEHWRDARARFGFDLGLGKGLGISVGSSSRSLSGYGAFERGLEDTRLGMSYWPALSPRIAAGINGGLSVPTGYRDQHLYYDKAQRTSLALPAMSLGQSAGEIYTGAVWTLGPAAVVNLFGGYFCTSDRTEQAFRWGLGTRLSPFGEKGWLELNYSQSITRTGVLPTTDSFEVALPFRAGWGVTLVPGLWADLDTEPLYGASLGLRFSAQVPGMLPAKPSIIEVMPPKLAGVVLVSPPLTDIVLADGKKLWQSIQDGVHASFDEVVPLNTLDVPGLPFADHTDEQMMCSVRALAQAHPEADWLLISRVIHEDVSKANALSVPYVVKRPGWSAQCRLKVELVDLRKERVFTTQVIEACAVKNDYPQLALLSPPDDTVLSLNASRQLTFEAYRNAGQQIARELVGGK